MNDSKLSRASELLGEYGPIAERLNKYTPRPQQQAMAALIEQVLEDGSKLLCEAGTGTGKTLAYLVPCLDVDRKTIISTATKTLQDQLFERDIPLVVNALQVDVSVALLKGRANYLCLHRLDTAAGRAEFSPTEIAEISYLQRWAGRTDSGDLAGAVELSDGSSVLPFVTSTVDNCLGQACDFFDDCFVVKARREAAKAEIVVVNHHLLFADMALREEGFAELLPTADAIVLDEAHHIPDVASKFFGSSLSSNQLRELCIDSLKAADSEAPDMPMLRERAYALDAAVAEFISALRRVGPRGDWAAAEQGGELTPGLELLNGSLFALRDALEIASERGPVAENCYNRSLRFGARLALFLGVEEDVDFQWIRWFETAARGVTLHATPVSIAEPFQAMVGPSEAAWIFTSATLSVNGDFGHFKRELGLVEPVEASWDSPFDYAELGYLLLPRIEVEPRHPDYSDAILDVAVPLIEAARGRTFLLFTSYAALQRCAERLVQRVDFPLLVQGRAPRAELLRQFETLGNAVLLGTATFWQGIDVRGSGLSCVLIDKLPFAPPDDPVTRARIGALHASGGNPFFDYQVPEAVLALKQGAGRLIRDANDSGVLVLCDPRLESKSYGKRFLNSMPALRRTHELGDATAFLSRQ